VIWCCRDEASPRDPPGGGLPERILLSVSMPFLRSSSPWKKKLGEGKSREDVDNTIVFVILKPFFLDFRGVAKRRREHFSRKA
jgi:hypothetical protein